MNTDNPVANFYRASAEDFKKIPGSPIAYWVSKAIINSFKSEQVKNWTISEGQNKTANNDKFVRIWSEVSFNSIGRNKKWLAYAKGGDFRKWYGNKEHIVDWSESARSHYRKDSNCRIIAKSLWYKEGITWTLLTSARQSFRILGENETFDMTGSSVFIKENYSLSYLLAFLNSIIATTLNKTLNPTLALQIKNVRDLPILLYKVNKVTSISEKNIRIAKSDWDSYETSWDFTTLPLLTEPYRSSELKIAWYRLRAHWIETTLEMQRLEEENNRIFISAYGLEDELTPNVPLEEITLTCNPYYRYGNKVEESETAAPPSGIAADSAWPWNNTLEDRLVSDTMKELLSYAVGCIFGRYSLDKEGLILANAGEGLEEYLKSITEPTLMPDESGILPLTEEDDFCDDLPTQVKAFIKIAFDHDHFDANIRFIEDAIGRDIRSYLLKDFYKDHVQRYKKRPIYWMATSPKGTFRALFYLHRYSPDTVGRLLNDYVRPFMKKLSNKIENDLHQLSFGSLSRADAARTQKRIDKHREALKEIEGWEKKVYETATRRIELDLDDGVKVNYGKLSDILEPVKGLDS